MIDMLRGRYGGLIECVLVFLVAVGFHLLIFFCVPWFFADDDVYVHTIRAASYMWNIDVPFPVATVFAREGIGFYQLYYLLHVPFLALASFALRGGLFLKEAPPLDVLFVGAKLFHATLLALFYVAVFWITRRMYGRMAALISLALLFTTSNALQFRFFVMRPHTLASLLFLLFVIGLIWRKYSLVFITAVTTVLSYTVSFMLIVPALLISLVERKATLLAMALGGLILGVVLHPLGLDYVNYAWLAHLLSAGLAAFDMHPASPGEFNSVSTAMLLGTWMLIIFCSIVLCILRAKAAQDFLKDRKSAELLIITVFFIPLMLLSPRGSEYFIPMFCVLAAGFLTHMLGPRGRIHGEGSDKEIRILAKVLIVVSFVSTVVMSIGWYQLFLLSFDPRPSFEAARCVGDGRVYSRDFGDYAFFAMSTQRLHFLTGIDPIFTVIDPVYMKYSSVLFGVHDRSLNELLPVLRELETDYIVTSANGFGWIGEMDALIKDDRLQPVCLRPEAQYIFFKILPS